MVQLDVIKLRVKTLCFRLRTLWKIFMMRKRVKRLLRVLVDREQTSEIVRAYVELSKCLKIIDRVLKTWKFDKLDTQMIERRIKLTLELFIH